MSVETVFVLSLMVLFIVILFKFLGWISRGNHPSSENHARPVEDAGEFQQKMAQDHRHHTDAAALWECRGMNDV
jgi:hypothetical protein